MEPLRLQKVLQGQEILGFNTPYKGIDAQGHDSAGNKFYPDNNGSRSSTAAENHFKIVRGESIASYEGTLNESLRFNKVLQGQETSLNLSYGRGPVANQVLETLGNSIIGGIQVPNGNGWSHIRGYHAHTDSSHRQVPSPASVLMFQQTTTPVSKLNAIPSNNLNKVEASLDISGRYGRQINSCSSSEGSFRREDHHGFGSGFLKEHNGTSFGFSNQTALRGGPSLNSLCKSNCRIFGFPLTEGESASSEEINPTQAVSPSLTMSPVPGNMGQLYPKSPLVNKVAGSSYSKVTDLYSVRDMLLDIAL